MERFCCWVEAWRTSRRESWGEREWFRRVQAIWECEGVVALRAHLVDELYRFIWFLTVFLVSVSDPLYEKSHINFQKINPKQKTILSLEIFQTLVNLKTGYYLIIHRISSGLRSSPFEMK